MSFAQQVGWNNAPFRFMRCKPPGFSHSSDGGSIPNRYLTVTWNRLWIFILIQLHSASQLSTFAHFAVLERHRVKFRVQNATVGGDGDGDDDS